MLPALSRLTDLKLLSGLPQYGLTNDKLEALAGAAAAGSGGGSAGGTDTGAAAGGVACLHLGSLARLHVEVSGVGQVDVGVAALSRLRGLRQLWLDGVVTLGPAVTAALRELPGLQVRGRGKRGGIHVGRTVGFVLDRRTDERTNE